MPKGLDRAKDKTRINAMGRVAQLLVAMPREDRAWVLDRVRSDLARADVERRRIQREAP